MRFRKHMYERFPDLFKKSQGGLTEAEIAHDKKIAREIFGIEKKIPRPNPVDDPGKCLVGSLS